MWENRNVMGGDTQGLSMVHFIKVDAQVFILLFLKMNIFILYIYFNIPVCMGNIF